MRGIHRSPVNSPHKGQWRGALMFSLIYVRLNGWVNNREVGDLRRYRAHYDVIIMARQIGDVPHKKPIIRSLAVFLGVSLNMLLNKLSVCQLFEIPLGSGDITVIEKTQNQGQVMSCDPWIIVIVRRRYTSWYDTSLLLNSTHLHVKKKEHGLTEPGG